MRLVRSNHFKRRFDKTPEDIKRRTEKALRLLATDLQHPSLHTKIYDKKKRVWQARVDGGWRLYFQIRGDTIYLLTIGPHPK